MTVSGAPLKASLPPDLQLYAGCTIRIALLSPTTSGTVAGGRASNVSIFVRNIGPSAGGDNTELASGLFKLVSGP